MAMTFNQFQAELVKRNIDPQMRMILTELYSQQRELGKQMDQLATIIDQVVGSVSKFADLHEATQGSVDMLRKAVRNEVDGVEVDSELVGNEPSRNN